MKLNGSAMVPLYRQVMNDLRGQIDEGRLSPGDKIPSEAELSERYAVSRITIRRAVEELVGAGQLTKRQGKGTYVNPPKLSHKVVQRRDVRTFADTCRDAGRMPALRVLGCDRGVATPEDDLAFLGLADGGSFVHTRTLGCADGVPVLLEDDYLPFDEFGFLMELDFADKSIFETIAAHVNRCPACAERCRVEIVRADADIAELLAVPVSEPLFSIDACLRDGDGMPLVVSRAGIVGSRFAFELA